MLGEDLAQSSNKKIEWVVRREELEGYLHSLSSISNSTSSM